jgi:U3 small nucleolar RNA-associated protein 14
MVEGFLTISDTKESYELPSQAELIRQAEKPALVPGWGQWTDIQQKKGLPSWMIKEHEIAKRNREEALKRRKDSKLKHVIISEHVDKKVNVYLICYIQHVQCALYFCCLSIVCSFVILL